MSSTTTYTPPKGLDMGKEPRAIEDWRDLGREPTIAGPTHEAKLPVGKHALQLYSRGTPNGVKVTVMLE